MENLLNMIHGKVTSEEGGLCSHPAWPGYPAYGEPAQHDPRQGEFWRRRGGDVMPGLRRIGSVLFKEMENSMWPLKMGCRQMGRSQKCFFYWLGWGTLFFRQWHGGAVHPAGSGSRKVNFYHFKITDNSLFGKDNNEVFLHIRSLRYALRYNDCESLMVRT